SRLGEHDVDAFATHDRGTRLRASVAAVRSGRHCRGVRGVSRRHDPGSAAEPAACGRPQSARRFLGARARAAARPDPALERAPGRADAGSGRSVRPRHAGALRLDACGGLVVRRVAVVLLMTLVMSATVGACGDIPAAAPRCRATPRLGIMAQSVPDASYVPCILDLPSDWSTGAYHVGRGHADFTLATRRSGARPVHVRLPAGCALGGATPTTPRADGVRTYRVLRSISPRYAGELFDVFAGGCVTYRFDFARGPHIGLTADFQTAVGLFSQR